MPGILRKEAAQEYLEGVPKFTYAVERDSFIQALRSVAQALGREISYPMLKGFSATGFRLMFAEDWRRFTPDALCGFDHADMAFQALGLRANALEIAPAEPARDASRNAIIQSIASGYPVMALRLMTWEDWGVIAGYRDHGAKLLCRTPHDPTAEFAENTQWPWLIFIITGEAAVPDRKVSALKSLRTAIELFETERYGRYYSGKAAYVHWLTGLKNSDSYQQLGERAALNYRAWIAQIHRAEADNFNEDRPYASRYLERAHVNSWRLTSLLDARRAAAAYLKEIAAWFSAPSAARLLQAGQLHSEIHELLGTAKPFAPSEWKLEEDPWNQEKRNQQAHILEKVLDLEEQAVACLKKVLEGDHDGGRQEG